MTGGVQFTTELLAVGTNEHLRGLLRLAGGSGFSTCVTVRVRVQSAT